ncbi:MAG: hypothetical protein IJ778_04930 [Alphaproteobacteria bacterium]|nr:hypothetical protein [Alphaproteobacteria bacterium]
MKMSKEWSYDYANKCDCADDDNCGCSYPENMPRTYTKNETKNSNGSAGVKSDDGK